ncbi:MAG: DNA polymerase III subunit gamma/tau [Paludibacteraceae bacterium]|nr:DNA polymerase III subunit gamma/tau [Paludibacteraceae bacterium]
MENYIVSARKYRPLNFESVVGQEALTQTLRNAIRQNHLAHAYLFCGSRGVGKTTCARIFAKTINCLNPTAEHDACNECESCRAFNEQRSFNIHELDAASNNSVDDIRALIDQVRIPPQVGKYSVYIIDEVHMLSAGAFNALLKTLEEPPSYAIFILATTEKHKVLPTILSRCQVYDFSRITVADIIRHLQYVASQEGVEASEEALNVVAQKADGGMRDALSIFDQLVSFCGNKITYEQTINVLNVLDTDYYFRLVDLALAGDVQKALLLFNEVLNKGFDAQHFITGFAQHLRDVLVSKDAQTVALLETSEAIRKHYQEQAGRCAAPWIFRALDLANTCDIQYRTAKNKRLTVELMLIKLTQLVTPETMPVSAPQKLAPVQPKASAPKEVPAQVKAVPAPVKEAAVKETPAPVAPKQEAPKPAPPIGMPQMPSIPSMPSMPSVNIPSGSATAAASEAPQETTPRNIPFTVDQFNSAWTGLAKLYPEEPRLATVFAHNTPELAEDHRSCVLTLVNPFQFADIKSRLRFIESELHKRLHNDQLRVQLEVAAYTREMDALTMEDRYKVMAEKNPHLAELKNRLNMVIE